jgi:uncharacterized membrane-anchored protein
MESMNTLLLAAVSSSGLVNLVVSVVVAGLIFWVLWWLVHYVGIPQPFLKVIEVIIAVCAVLWLINVLLGLSGNSFVTL